MMDLNFIGLRMVCMRTLAPNDQVSGGEQKENKALRRYATERMTNPYEGPFRKVDWRAMRGAAE